MADKLCACTAPMDNVKGVWVCGHCDQPCKEPKPCPTCTTYSMETQRRINHAARTDKPETPGTNPPAAPSA